MGEIREPRRELGTKGVAAGSRSHTSRGPVFATARPKESGRAKRNGQTARLPEGPDTGKEGVHRAGGRGPPAGRGDRDTGRPGCGRRTRRHSRSRPCRGWVAARLARLSSERCLRPQRGVPRPLAYRRAANNQPNPRARDAPQLPPRGHELFGSRSPRRAASWEM